MSDSSPAPPRRSQRERKSTQVFQSQSSTGKRKRQANSDAEDNDPNTDENPLTEDDDAGTSDADADADEDDAEGEEEEGYEAAKPKARQLTRKSTNEAKKPRGRPPTKKPKATKPITTGKNPKKPTGAKRGRKPKDAASEPFDAEQVSKDSKINADNPIFNAILNPSAALQSTVEDFLESLDEDAGTSLAELINFILRACGCNDSVNADEVVDYDGVVDALDNFTEGLKKDDSPTYPLTSKLPMFKKFRTHLSEFISRLISAAADTGALYTSELMAIIQTWVVAMSSSQIRSFRHTATAVALEMEAALCDVAKGIDKEVEVVGRQREGEKKKRAKGSAKTTSARDKELEKKAKEIRLRKGKVEEYLKEFINTVFVHRYRDTDPLIRAECTTSLGVFFKKHPAHFLSTSYLQYVGWVLSDQSTPVRQAAIKSLQIVYASSNELLSSFSSFTERFRPRLLEMAERDTDISVRVGVLSVLGSIDKAGLLEEEDRERLGALVFHEEPRIRRAVGNFVRGVWDEWVQEQMDDPEVKKLRSDDVKVRVGLKGLATLLVKWGKTLDEVIGDDEEDDSDPDNVVEGSSTGLTAKQSRQKAALAAVTSSKSASHGRITLAVETLWDDMDCLSDWQAILDLLLLDHSAANENPPPSSPRKARRGQRGHASSEVSQEVEDEDAEKVEEAWRLHEIEEDALLEVLSASLLLVQKEAHSKKSEDETISNDVTRALIEALPRLFAKYQTDESRISHILALPVLMNLELYLEMRMIPNFSILWDNITKQFTTHSSPTVLTAACRAIVHMLSVTSLSNTNSTKIVELEEALASQLRDTIAGREEVEIAGFTEDEILALTSISLRARSLASMRNITSWLEEDEDGKQSSAWDIFNAITDRGQLGYREEETLMAQSLGLLTLHVFWKKQEMSSSGSHLMEDEKYMKKFLTQRETLLEKLSEYAIGSSGNAVPATRHAAFQNLLHLYIMFRSPDDESESPVHLAMEDRTQSQCAGYLQAEIEGYAEALTGMSKPKEKSDESALSSEDDEEKNEGKKDVDPTSRSRLVQDYAFHELVSAFLRALRCGVIDVRHTAIILAHYGRLGSVFDTFAKIVMDLVRQESLLGDDNGDLLVHVVISSVQEACKLVLDGAVKNADNARQLAKSLSTHFVIRGTQLAVVKRLDSGHIVRIQTTLLSWLGKRLAESKISGNQRNIRKILPFFKVFAAMVSQLQQGDALQIKAHLDQVLAQAKVEPDPSAKSWDPYRSYERRLGAATTKEKGARGRKGKKKTDGDGTTDDETEGELDEVLQRTPRATRSRAKAKAKAKPKAKTKKAATPEMSAEEDEREATPTLETPKAARTRNKAASSSKKSSAKKKVIQEDEDEDGDGESDGEEVLPTPTRSTRKRRRNEAEDEPATAEEASEDQQPEATGGLQVRRKRVRH